MTDASLYVDSDALPWRESPSPGVQWKKLRYDAETGESAVLLKFEAGARYAAHEHVGGEEYLVLEGVLMDGGKAWGVGSYVRHAAGSRHVPWSRDGCVVFVVLRAPVRVLGE